MNLFDLKCKFNDNMMSVISVVFVSLLEIKCFVCNVVNGRCVNLVGSLFLWFMNG